MSVLYLRLQKHITIYKVVNTDGNLNSVITYNEIQVKLLGHHNCEIIK